MAAQAQISSLRDQLQTAKAAGGAGGGPSVDKAIETASKEATVSDDDGHHAAAGVLAGEVQALRKREEALTDLLAKSQRSMKKLRESQSEIDPKSGLVKGADATVNVSPAAREAADQEAKKRAAADRAELDTTKIVLYRAHEMIKALQHALKKDEEKPDEPAVWGPAAIKAAEEKLTELGKEAETLRAHVLLQAGDISVDDARALSSGLDDLFAGRITTTVAPKKEGEDDDKRAPFDPSDPMMQPEHIKGLLSELHQLRSLAVEGARDRDRDVVKSFERSLTDPAAQAQMAKELKFNRDKAGGLQWGDFIPEGGDGDGDGAGGGGGGGSQSSRHGRGIVSGVTYKADVKHKSVGVKASTMTSLMETVAVSHPGGIDATEYGDALDPSQLEELARMSAAAANDSFAYTMDGVSPVGMGGAGGAAAGFEDESHLDTELEKVRRWPRLGTPTQLRPQPQPQPEDQPNPQA